MLLKAISAIFIASFGVACGAQSAATAPAGQYDSRIIMAPDTTVFTGPLRPDGTVDYVAAANAQESQGITAGSNAACVLVRIVEGDLNKSPYIEQRAEMLRLMGVENKPGDDIAWQFWSGFKHPIPTDDPESPNYRDRFEWAKTHPWSSKDIPEIAEWLKANEPALAIAEEASKRQQFWLPEVPLQHPELGLVSAIHPELNTWANVRDALCIRSMLKLQQGDTPGALYDLLITQRLGHLLGQSPEPVTLLVGAGFQSAACFSSWRLLQDSGIAKDHLQRWSADLVAMGQILPPRRRVSQRSRYIFLDTVQFVASTQNKELLKHMNANQLPAFQRALADVKLPLLDWNRVMRFGNSFYDDLEKDLSSLPASQRAAEEKAFNERYDQLDQTTQDAHVNDAGNPPKWIFPKPGESREVYSDRVAAILLDMELPSIGRMSESVRLCNARVDWTAKVGVALAIYRNEHGEYPATLDALIPKYLDRLPPSTFANPLNYERRGGGYLIRNVRVYSEVEKRLLAERNENFDLDDIIIRTDKSE